MHPCPYYFTAYSSHETRMNPHAIAYTAPYDWERISCLQEMYYPRLTGNHEVASRATAG